jgi:hypothetical protein
VTELEPIRARRTRADHQEEPMLVETLLAGRPSPVGALS